MFSEVGMALILQSRETFSSFLMPCRITCYRVGGELGNITRQGELMLRTYYNTI